MGKDKKSILKGYIVFGYGTNLIFFIDMDNNLGKGKNAIYAIKIEKPKLNDIKNSCYMAKDFSELFEIIE
jgi:hypothetical protein